MLNDTLARLRAIRPGMAHFSLLMVGLMWIFPFLYFEHSFPLVSFYSEWWCVVLGVFALTLLAARGFWQQPETPRIVHLPAGFIAILLLQMSLHKLAYIEQGWMYIGYLLFAALLMLLGARLRICFGFEKMAIILAIFLLVGAELSALIGVLQHFRWHTPLDAVVLVKPTSSLVGNLAQPNHFANYTALGLVSLGLLFQRYKLKAVYAVLLAVPLLFVMTLSGSRSSWLYLLMMSGLAWWWSRRDAQQRTLLGYSLLLLAVFGLMHLIVKLPFMAGAEGGVDTMQRLFVDKASGSIRLYLWHEAWLMFARSPWLGVGFGQFAWHHFQLLPVLRPSNISGLYNNAHNLIFHVAAEAGLAGLLALFASLGAWLYGLRRATLDAAHWWGYAALGVLAIHSLLEYPLWYTFFIAVAAILLGALDETRYRLKLRNIGRISMAGILLLGLLTLVQLHSGYQLLKRTLVIRPASSIDFNAIERIRAGIIEVRGIYLLTPYADMFLAGSLGFNDSIIDTKIALTSAALHFIPTSQLVYQQAFLLAQSGRLEPAKLLIEQALWSYPSDAEAFKLLTGLAERYPARFSALLEFALKKEQEHTLAVRQQ